MCLCPRHVQNTVDLSVYILRRMGRRYLVHTYQVLIAAIIWTRWYIHSIAAFICTRYIYDSSIPGVSHRVISCADSTLAQLHRFF